MLKSIYEKILAAYKSLDAFGFIAALAALASYVKEQWGGDAPPAPPAGAVASAMAPLPDDLIAFMEAHCSCEAPEGVEHGLFGGNFDWIGFMTKLITLFGSLKPAAAKK